MNHMCAAGGDYPTCCFEENGGKLPGLGQTGWLASLSAHLVNKKPSTRMNHVFRSIERRKFATGRPFLGCMLTRLAN